MRNDNVESVINKPRGCAAQLVHWVAYEKNAYCMPEQSPVKPRPTRRGAEVSQHTTSASAAELFEPADATWRRRQTVRAAIRLTDE